MVFKHSTGTFPPGHFCATPLISYTVGHERPRHTAPPRCSPLAASPIPHRVQALSTRLPVTSRSCSRVPARLLHWDSFLRVWATSTITREDQSSGAEDEDALRRSRFLCSRSSVLEQSPSCYSSC